MIKYINCILLLSLIMLIRVNASEDLFFEANSLYDQEQYEDAINTYEELLKESASANLHFNLANAYNKQAGLAVYHYNKAKLLEPRNPDISANLRFVSEALEISISEAGFLKKVAYMLTVNTWSVLLSLSGWAFIIIALIWKFSKWRGPIPASALAVTLIILGFSFCGLLGYHNERNTGIVISNDAALKRAPTKNSPVHSYLSAGEQFFTVDQHSNYLKIDNLNGKSGWVSKNDFRKLWEEI